MGNEQVQSWLFFIFVLAVCIFIGYNIIRLERANSRDMKELKEAIRQEKEREGKQD